jgi:rhamnosyltransferase
VSPRVSLVVPTLNAGSEIGPLLESILGQTIVPDEVLVIDSSSDDDTSEVVGSYRDRGVLLEVIDRADFNHGGTRDYAFSRTSGEYTLFMTQDALPASRHYVESLISPFDANCSVALVSGRQLPKSSARRFEQLVREFNYPSEPSVRDAGDLARFGIKTFFASDVCSAYRRDAYVECGGFDRVNTNEDMLMAARFIGSGYAVAYEPSAAVYHSHNLTPLQQFNRNREVGAFLAVHAGEFMGASEFGEGGRLVKFVSAALLREGRVRELAAFGVDCAARLLGNRIGRLSAKELWKEMV